MVRRDRKLVVLVRAQRRSIYAGEAERRIAVVVNRTVESCGAMTCPRRQGRYTEISTKTRTLAARQVEICECYRIETGESRRQSAREEGGDQVRFRTIARQHRNVRGEVGARCRT